MAGFAAKYYMFYAALLGGHPELLIIGVLASILGIYYYLRPIATMFMTQSEDAPQKDVTPALAGIPPMPRTVTKAVTGTSRRTSGSLASKGGTAIAVKTPPAQVEATPLAPPVAETPAAQETTRLTGFTWLALIIAAVGTLVVGVVLPIWLPNIQQAAQMLLK